MADRSELLLGLAAASDAASLGEAVDWFLPEQHWAWAVLSSDVCLVPPGRDSSERWFLAMVDLKNRSIAVADQYYIECIEVKNLHAGDICMFLRAFKPQAGERRVDFTLKLENAFAERVSDRHNELGEWVAGQDSWVDSSLLVNVRQGLVENRIRQHERAHVLDPVVAQSFPKSTIGKFEDIAPRPAAALKTPKSSSKPGAAPAVRSETERNDSESEPGGSHPPTKRIKASAASNSKRTHASVRPPKQTKARVEKPDHEEDDAEDQVHRSPDHRPALTYMHLVEAAQRPTGSLMSEADMDDFLLMSANGATVVMSSASGRRKAVQVMTDMIKDTEDCLAEFKNKAPHRSRAREQRIEDAQEQLRECREALAAMQRTGHRNN